MSHRHFSLLATGLCALPLLAACATLNSADETAMIPSDQFAETIMAWWDGAYENDAQISALKANGDPIWMEGVDPEDNNGGYLPVKSYYSPIDMPAFGEHVLYLEEFTFDDNPYRQRFYTVNYDEETDTTSVKLWYFKDKTTWAGAWEDLDKVRDLTPEDMSPLPDNCDLFVEQTPNGRLEMKMPKNECKFGSSIFDYQVSLGPDDFWYRDQIVNADTMDVKMSAGDFGWHKLDKK